MSIKNTVADIEAAIGCQDCGVKAGQHCNTFTVGNTGAGIHKRRVFTYQILFLEEWEQRHPTLIKKPDIESEVWDA